MPILKSMAERVDKQVELNVLMNDALKTVAGFQLHLGDEFISHIEKDIERDTRLSSLEQTRPLERLIRLIKKLRGDSSGK